MTRDAVGAVLFCREQAGSGGGNDNWRTFTISRWQADRAMNQIQSKLDNYKILDTGWPVKILTPASVDYDCHQSSGMGD